MGYRMIRLALGVALLGLVASAGRAEAGLTYFDFSFTDGGALSGSGTLVATANGDGSYTAVSGTLIDNFGDDGLALVPNPSPPGEAIPPGNPGFYYDDQLFPGQDPTVDANGLLFGTGGGVAGTLLVIYGFPGEYFALDNAGNIGPMVSFTLTSVPEPSSLAMCAIAGAIGLVVARVRRKRVG